MSLTRDATSVTKKILRGEIWNKKNSEGGDGYNLTTVLLVDDSRISRLLTRAIISRHYPQWQILEAESGEDALTTAQGHDVQFMLVDHLMSGMDGLQAAAMLRDQHPEARLSLLTANIQDTMKERAEAAGFGFMTKPLREDQIVAFLSDGAAAC